MDITIRHVEKSDFAALRDILASTENYSSTLQLPYPSLGMWEKRLEAKPDNVYRLVAEFNSEVIGEIGLSIQTNPRRKHVADIGMVVRDDCQGKGVGSQLLCAVIDLAEQWLAVSRIELSVYADNSKAIALYEKHGFKIEGHAKNYAFRKGEYVDAYHMARLVNP
ncbi:GNAT family N-acetyltransferase [Photobacterium minamisatsumaniensis]|uniref:GNAT family N-acetyltransferase n=1 Tax=Photobacterium minamisatsumaniensis TaxID=2910233 RepID=UPI003D0C854C